MPTHFAANLMSVTPKASGRGSRRSCGSVYDQPDASAVHAQFDRITESLREKLPTVAEYLEDAREDILAFTIFPKACWRQICVQPLSARLVVSHSRSVRELATMSISPGFTTEEIREFVHRVQIQPYGQKGSGWLGQGVLYERSAAVAGGGVRR